MSGKPTKKPRKEENVATLRLKNSRVHSCNPNDGFYCEPCGVTHYQSIYQHMLFKGTCPPSVYFLTLQDKMLKGHIYLLQRHKEHPKFFQSPGKFVMFSVKMSNNLMKSKFSLELLQQQDKNWNVLMPIVERVVGGKEVGKKTVFHLAAELAAEDGGPKDSDWMMDQSDNIEMDWKIEHNWKVASLGYTEEQQLLMEKTRHEMGQALMSKLRFKWPCSGDPFYNGRVVEKTGKMPLLKN